MFDVARNTIVTNISDIFEVLEKLFSILSFLFFNVLSERVHICVFEGKIVVAYNIYYFF